MPYPNTHSAHIRGARGDVRTVTPDGWPEGITALADDDGMVSVRADASVVDEAGFRAFLRSRDIDAEVEPATGEEPDDSVDMMRDDIEMGRRDMYDLPEYMVGWLRTGLDNLDRAGSGLVDATVDAARDGVRTGQWSGQKIIEAAAWHARHGEQAGAIRDDDGMTPKGVSTYLWADNGSGRGARWLASAAERVKRDGGEMNRYAKAVTGGVELRRHVEVVERAAGDGTRTLHILRRGPLYDVDTGEKLLDVDAGMVSAIVANGNALIEAGQTIPVSVEHGIERGQRGDNGADRTAYGSVLGFEERDGEVYARVRYTAAGREYLARHVTGEAGHEGEATAVYVSPRVMAEFAHPDTGESMGRVIDVVSLTTGPRQNRMQPVELSRGSEFNNAPARGEEVGGMAVNDTPTGAGVDVLLARGGDDTGRILAALELSRDASAGDILDAVRKRGDELSRVTGERDELARFKADTERAARAAEAVTLLSRHGIDEKAPEFGFYRDSLAAGGPAADGVRGVLKARGEVDLSRQVGEAFDAAVRRGAFAAGEREAVLSRVTPETAAGIVAMIEARPDHAHSGTPSAAPGGGPENAPPADDPKAAKVELSRRIDKRADEIAREAAAAGNNIPMTEAYRRATAEVK